MSDFGFDDDDPFGEEPDWARDDSDQDHYGGGGGMAPGDTTTNGNRYDSYHGADHVLVLLDCHSSMFQPCMMHTENDDDDDDDDDDDNHEKNDTNDNGKCGNGTTGNNNNNNNKLLTPMDVALMASYNLLRLRIRHVATMKQGKRDGVGVLLYGCNVHRRANNNNNNNNAMDYCVNNDNDDDDDDDGQELMPSTHELLTLEPPGTEQSLKIQECLPPALLGSNNLSNTTTTTNGKRRNLEREFSTNYENGKDATAASSSSSTTHEMESVPSLRSALHEANKLFMSAKCVKADSPSNKIPDSKSIWIFTNQDDPCHGNEIEKKHIAIAAKDAFENGIDIHLIPLPRLDDHGNIQCNFDKDIFYNSIVSPQQQNKLDINNTNCFTQNNDGKVDIYEVLDLFDKAMTKVRKVGSIPMFLPGWEKRKKGEEAAPGIMLDLYSTVQSRSKGAPVTIHQEKNKATIKKTTLLDMETGAAVTKDMLHTFVDFCGHRVSISRADLAEMKKLSNSKDEASLVLIGFRPMQSFDITNIVAEKSYRAFSNDGLVRGSGKAIFNLKESMLRKGVYAVGELLTRYSASSKLVAIIPEQDFGGLLIVPLPFRDDTRHVPHDDIGVAERSVVDAAKTMISKSGLDDIQFGQHFENPALKHFFNFLESVSLGRELLDISKEDDTRMDEEHMERARKGIEAFSLSLPEDEEPEKKERGVKRTREQPRSVTQPENAVIDIDEEWIDLYKDDAIADCTATKLKEFLRSVGERIGGKKIDLIDRVHRVIQKNITAIR